MKRQHRRPPIAAIALVLHRGYDSVETFDVACRPRLDRTISQQEQEMAQPQKPTSRKPATKFAHLTKKMDKGKLRTKMAAQHVRKSGNR
jgi:hypothetical protein